MTGHLTAEAATAHAYGLTMGEEREEIAVHLEACPECAARVARLAADRRKLGAALEEAPAFVIPQLYYRVALATVAACLVAFTGWLLFLSLDQPVRGDGPASVAESPASREVVVTPPKQPPQPPVVTSVSKPDPPVVKAPEPPPAVVPEPVVEPQAPPPPEPPSPPPPAPRPTKVFIATLQIGAERQDLEEGATVRTGKSGAEVRFPDGTRLELKAATEIVISDAAGKRVTLSSGMLAADVVKQPAGEPMVFATPQAEATVLGTKLLLGASRDLAWIEVTEGRVRFGAVEVPAGRFAVANAGFDVVLGNLAAGVDRMRVEEAIRKGATFLKGACPVLDAYEFELVGRKMWLGELVLLTFLHAGVPESDPDFQGLFKRMMERPLDVTYRVALQAMILQKLDPVEHQGRIVQCAQFLVDNQCRNGQWNYGEPSPFVEGITPGKYAKRVAVLQRRKGPEAGDNSNTQYAALGLRACHDAGVAFQPEVIRRARKWWVDSQRDDRKLKKDPRAGRGWCYGALERLPDQHESYGAMTAGGVASVAIYDYILGMGPAKDRSIVDGLEWLARRFTVTEHPGPAEFDKGDKQWMRFYWLYALERACILGGTEKLGTHPWYVEGATMLLDSQKEDGSWMQESLAIDTCFAILFLRRSTEPLLRIASEGR